MSRNGRKETLPIIEERLRVDKRTVETGKVQISTRTEEREHPIRETLVHEDVAVERVKIDRFADHTPEIRYEGDVLIVPVCEEVLVKRIHIREELHITKKRRLEEVTDTVTLRRQEAVVTRTKP